MPLNSALLASEIVANIQSAFPDSFPDTGATIKFANAIATAVVVHIQSNAIVNVVSVSGVTTGGGVSGPGTGTIS